MPDLSAGQGWVVAQLSALLEEAAVPFDRLEWISTTPGFDQGYELLLIHMRDGITHRERFRTRDLEDVTNGAMVQAKILVQLGAVRARFANAS